MDVGSRARRTPRRIVGLIATGGLVVGMLAALIPTAPVASAGATQHYLVLYAGNAVSSSSITAIRAAGGTFVYSYPQIGVAFATSDSATFGADLRKRDARVAGVSATDRFATRLTDDSATGSSSSAVDPGTPAPGSDSLSGLQWDMDQIKAPQAHAINGGSSSVVVGDIDTGLDWTHEPGAWMDDNGHGTHTAGTIAAAKNGIGIVGVAPNVKIAGIKAGNAAGFFFPEAVVCAFIWAGTHHIQVTNNSYFADPWLYNCKNDPVQRAIWTAERRAIAFAMNGGTTVVAAEGNDADDTAHPTFDRTSPDDTTPEVRVITNACVIIPVEVPGVIGVTATGAFEQGTTAGKYPDHLKSFFSSFGVGVTEVTAPGGDSRYGRPPVAIPPAASRVLSTWPANLANTAFCNSPGRGMTEPGIGAAFYCYQQGTSMASPHAAGVAALIVSRYGDASNPQNGKMRPSQVAAYLQQTADPQACPTTFPSTPVPYLSFLGVNSEAVQQCQGGTGNNSWYGNGEVDALNAVTKSSGNH